LEPLLAAIEALGEGIGKYNHIDREDRPEKVTPPGSSHRTFHSDICNLVSRALPCDYTPGK
jgi:hypothetical protein